MRYMRLPFIYPYRSVNIKYANSNAALTNAALTKTLITPMPTLKNVDPELLERLAPQSITTYNLPSLSPSVEQPANTFVNPPVQTKGQLTLSRLQPGPAGTPLTRKEVMRMLNKALRKRPPGMGFGGALMWTALGGLGGVLLDRLFSSGSKKREYPYYAPYIPGYRLY